MASADVSVALVDDFRMRVEDPPTARGIFCRKIEEEPRVAIRSMAESSPGA